MARGPNPKFECAPTDRGARIRRLLSKVDGLSLENGFEGRFTVGPHWARLRIEPDHSLRVVHEVEAPRPPSEALKANLCLPGNVRFALVSGRMFAVADTQLDGELHLASSFREIGRGLCGAIERPPQSRRRGKPIEPEKVQDALDKGNWGEDAVVRLEDGWELRPRIRGETTPVRMAVEGQAVRICRVVVAACHNQSESAVALQALCFNAQLRHARLAWEGEAVVAETRLHAGLINAAWLGPAARAVATATCHTRTTLEILARQANVTRHFEEMFCDAKEC
jgi:hypothetical protein